jgi:RNA polymerase sigma-70 factor (ECF subfamily)
LKHDVIEELFSKYYNDALLYTLSLTKNYPLAEETVSDAFYTALKTADGEVHNFKAWLLKVCRNLYFNSLRKNKRLEELNENLTDKSETALEKIIRKEEYVALYHAISLLNLSHKEVITLFYFEDLSIKDISLVVGKSEAYVKVTLFRAREALKKILSESL